MGKEGGLGGRFSGCFNHEEESLRVRRRRNVRGMKVQSDEASMVVTNSVLAKAMESILLIQKKVPAKVRYSSVTFSLNIISSV